MKKINLLIYLLFISQIICSQNVASQHEVTKGGLPNEFNIKTTVSGLEGVDLGRITYFISNAHTYKPTSKNPFFSKIEEGYIKFYIMSIPSNGLINIELGVVLSGEEDFEFLVEFQYSKNEEKVVVDCKPLIIKNRALLALEEPSLNDKIQAADLQVKKEETKQKAEEQIKQEETAAAKAIEDAALAVKIEKIRVIAKQEEEEERLAKEKVLEDAKKQKEADILAAKKAEEEKVSVSEKKSSTGVQYGVQIFALSKYTEQKVRDFCKRNNLEYSKINTLEVKGITRVRYGSVNSKEEAEKLKKELLTRPQINGGYVVKL